ncbi:MAG TPA: DUF58 domain-containing protein [Lacunisphaera sp.]|jgi:uncharacterized protein (DUF58 family)|nr:DUF58 domain-containing protein [Lacunisphaera sp.]
MNSTNVGAASPNFDWHGPGASDRRRRVFSWKTFLWSLVFPPKRHRIAPTITGLFLIGLAMGIGTAAYNTASNILFITLSLLLACLLLSGLMSWFNFTGVSWRLRPSGPWRAGHETFASVEVRNGKEWLPTYGLWFELLTQPRLDLPDEASGKDLRVREILAAAERLVTRGMLFMRERLEPGGSAELDWVVKPDRRGEAFIELVAVGSLFPFGFLKKSIGTGLRQPVLVWPAQVEYRWSGAMAAHGGSQGRRTARLGTGDDLLALRKYAVGDSHRLIHWKASARLGQLMIRQFAAESHDGFMLSLDTRAETWPHPEQFELLCSFAGTMAEDLFAAGRLRGVVLNGGTPLETRRLRDVEIFLDDLARLQPARPGGGVPSPREAWFPRGEGAPPVDGNLVTFAPAGARGVVALVDGREIASA